MSIYRKRKRPSLGRKIKRRSIGTFDQYTVKFPSVPEVTFSIFGVRDEVEAVCAAMLSAKRRGCAVPPEEWRTASVSLKFYHELSGSLVPHVEYPTLESSPY